MRAAFAAARHGTGKSDGRRIETHMRESSIVQKHSARFLSHVQQKSSHADDERAKKRLWARAAFAHKRPTSAPDADTSHDSAALDAQTSLALFVALLAFRGFADFFVNNVRKIWKSIIENSIFFPSISKCVDNI